MLPDGIHLSSEGHVLVARRIADALTAWSKRLSPP
jgi:lysophospholipase L1-like esterase